MNKSDCNSFSFTKRYSGQVKLHSCGLQILVRKPWNRSFSSDFNWTQFRGDSKISVWDFIKDSNTLGRVIQFFFSFWIPWERLPKRQPFGLIYRSLPPTRRPSENLELTLTLISNKLFVIDPNTNLELILTPIRDSRSFESHLTFRPYFYCILIIISWNNFSTVNVYIIYILYIYYILYKLYTV